MYIGDREAQVEELFFTDKASYRKFDSKIQEFFFYFHGKQFQLWYNKRISSFPMSEYLNPEVSPEVQDTLERWYNGPVVLASGSSYRRQQLIDMGFKHVTALSVPDPTEHHVHAWWEKRPFGTFFDSRKTDGAVAVAYAKVQYILETQDIPPDALVCAFDTMPMRFRYNEPHAGWDVREKL